MKDKRDYIDKDSPLYQTNPVEHVSSHNRVATENFPMSDTFFGNKTSNRGVEESVKAVSPLTYSSDVTDNCMIEDSMNVNLEEYKQPIYDEYNKLLYEFHKLNSKYKKVNKKLEEAEIKNKEFQLCSSYFEEMYVREKQDKKNAEIAFKRILNKMYNNEKFTPNEPVKANKYYSHQVSPHERDVHKHQKANRKISSKPMSPVSDSLTSFRQQMCTIVFWHPVMTSGGSIRTGVGEITWICRQETTVTR